ncbi:hypothetical protein OHV05_37725 (plasmid) [Kitasatospora sp. NBC_00070]|uniref:hypothetical protein n=1 Tax=Kitasatospora sp. NBC_00070 TaxID=2975962 RepID=UPI002F9193E0
MEITITVSEPSPVFQRQLLELLAEHRAAIVTDVPDSRWTVARAGLYFERLPPRAKEILHDLATVHGGATHPDELRRAGKNLRGSTSAFRRILNEGAKQGLWPDGLLVPVQSLTKGGKLIQLYMPGWNDPDDDTLQPFSGYFEAETQRRKGAKARPKGQPGQGS